MVDELLCCINVRHDPVAEANSRSVECSLYGYGGWRSARPAPTRAATVKRHSSQAGFRIQGLTPEMHPPVYHGSGTAANNNVVMALKEIRDDFPDPLSELQKRQLMSDLKTLFTSPPYVEYKMWDVMVGWAHKSGLEEFLPLD